MNQRGQESVRVFSSSVTRDSIRDLCPDIWTDIWPCPFKKGDQGIEQQ
jgi:hypothetical protein